MTTMTLDDWMPTFDVRSAHAVEVRAAPETVYRALLAADFSRNPVVAALMALRSLPAVVVAPRRALTRWRHRGDGANGGRTGSRPGGTGPMGLLLSGAFALLAARPPTEITFGLTGRFWTPTGGLLPTDPTRFLEPLPSGLARAVWTLRVDPLAAGRSRLSTETRVSCADPSTRRAFLRYWRLIGVGSHVIRLVLLRQVKRAAERMPPDVQ
jgi:hypothetical protein